MTRSTCCVTDVNCGEIDNHDIGTSSQSPGTTRDVMICYDNNNNTERDRGYLACINMQVTARVVAVCLRNTNSLVPKWQRLINCTKHIG